MAQDEKPRDQTCRDIIDGVTDLGRPYYVWTEFRGSVVEPPRRDLARTYIRANIGACPPVAASTAWMSRVVSALESDGLTAGWINSK